MQLSKNEMQNSTITTWTDVYKTAKSYPSHKSPHGDANLHLASNQQNPSLHCEIMDVKLVNHKIHPSPHPAFAAITLRMMARQSAWMCCTMFIYFYY